MQSGPRPTKKGRLRKKGEMTKELKGRLTLKLIKWKELKSGRRETNGSRTHHETAKVPPLKTIGSATGKGTYGIRRNFTEGELLKRTWLMKNVQEDYDPSLHWPAFKAGLLREHVYARNRTHAQKYLAEQIRLAL